MSIYTYNITNCKGDEQLIVGKGGQITTITKLIVTGTVDYTFSLLITRGSVTSTLFTYNMSARDQINKSGYIIDQASILSIDSDPGLDITIIGVTETATTGPVNSPPSNA